MQKVNDPAVRHTSSGALIRRFLPYLAKYKKTLFIDLFCAAMTTLCLSLIHISEPTRPY